MNLYLLNRHPADEAPSWDEMLGFVVCASNENEARSFADEKCGDEGRIWSIQDRATCVLVGTAVADVKAGVVLESFKAG